MAKNRTFFQWTSIFFLIRVITVLWVTPTIFNKFLVLLLTVKVIK